MDRITCFFSYSNDDLNKQMICKIKELLQTKQWIIDYSEKKDKREFSNETIWDYLLGGISGSSCTILLLTEDLFLNNKRKIDYVKGDFLNSGWVYNEISASLRDWKNNRINGLICLIPDYIYDNVDIKETDSILPFFNGKPSPYYKLPEILELNKEYIIFSRYNDFLNNPLKYINKARENRKSQIERKCFKIVYDPHNKW